MIRLVGDKVAVAPIFDPTFAGPEYADPRLGAPVELWIPDEARDRCDQGIVKYVGPQVKDLRLGDYVIFSGWVGALVTVDNETVIILPEKFCQGTLENHPDVDVPGLYFRGVDGEYFTATYEMAIEMVSRAFRDADWHKGVKVTSFAPKNKEYDELLGGAG